jgi:hypothetical protein
LLGSRYQPLADLFDDQDDCYNDDFSEACLTDNDDYDVCAEPADAIKPAAVGYVSVLVPRAVQAFAGAMASAAVGAVRTCTRTLRRKPVALHPAAVQCDFTKQERRVARVGLAKQGKQLVRAAHLLQTMQALVFPVCTRRQAAITATEATPGARGDCAQGADDDAASEGDAEESI